MMEPEWINDGEPDENGNVTALIKSSTGARVSTFVGKSIKEVADKILQSQVEANQLISRLRKPDSAKQSMRIEPKQLTPEDRMRLSSDITDPDKVVEAVEEIVTARQGVSPTALSARLAKMDKDEADAFYKAEATAFVDEHPEYYGVPQNRQALYDELIANGWPLTRNNLAIVFETLTKRGDMIPWPVEGQGDYIPGNGDNNPNSGGTPTPPPEPPARTNGQANATNAPSPRPRSISTGIRNSDASASAPAPAKVKKYTRADIERMSRSEYNDKLRSDPEFRRQVDAI